MKLRTKTIATILATLLVLIVVLYISSHAVLLKGFSRVEQDDLHRNVDRVEDALKVSIANLVTKSSDWAKWDDAYEFVVHPTQEFKDANLNDESVMDLKLNGMLFLDVHQKLVYGKTVDLVDALSYECKSSDLLINVPDSSLLSHDSIESVKAGIFMMPSGPRMIVSRPILTSAGEGPIHGTLIFYRHLDSVEVDVLAKTTHLAITLHALRDSASFADNDHTALVNLLYNHEDAFLLPENNDTIAGYSLIDDYSGKSALLLKVAMPRTIYKQGQSTLVYLVEANVIAGLIFGIVIIFLLERMVVSRVTRLDADVIGIEKSRDHSLRVQRKGADEIASLSGSINEMLATIEKSQHIITSRNREMRLLMDTLPDGVLSLDEHFCANAEYSESVAYILGKREIAGKSLCEILDIARDAQVYSQIIDFLGFVRDEALPQNDLAPLNPISEIPLSDNRWIRTQFYRIQRNDSLAPHILTVIEDITEAKNLQVQVEKSQSENLQLRAIAEDPDLFREFLAEMKAILAHAQERLLHFPSSPDRTSAVNELFRDVHTIKGTSSGFGLVMVSQIAGTMESTLSQVRETGLMTDALLAQTRESLFLLSEALIEVVKTTRKILGDDISDAGDIHIRLSLEKLKCEMSAINEMVDHHAIDSEFAAKLTKDISSRFRELWKIPAGKGFARAFKMVPSLITRLGKDIDFAVTGSDTLIDCEIARELSSVLVHLLRNCCDHGIEPVEDRLQKGKAATGKVSVAIREESSVLQVVISDDGRGMDTNVLKQAAIDKKILDAASANRLTPEECLQLIFVPGFTTTETVTDVSGRGVGMDVVKVTVMQVLKGTIEIDSIPGSGTKFFLRIPQVLLYSTT